MEQIRACLDILGKECLQIEPGDPLFRDPRIKINPLDGKNAHEIVLGKTGQRTLSFLDGGNNTILIGPNFTIELTRIYFNLFRANGRVNVKRLPPRIEFFTVVTTHTTTEGQVEFQGHLIPLKPEFSPYLPEESKLKLLASDRTLMIGKSYATVWKVADAARRFAEWKYTATVIENELQEGDLMIRDGTLQTSVTNEAYFADAVYAAAARKGVIFCGLAKTNRLLTTTGNSLAAVIKQLGDGVLPRKTWYYHPIAKIEIPDHKAEMFFVNLHPLSLTAFRFEIFRDQAVTMNLDDYNAIFSELVMNARDPSFPGYLYGLIDADYLARVPSQEVNNYQTIFLHLANQREDLEDLIAPLLGHDILNLSREVV